METIAWWSAGEGSENKEVKWRPLYGGAEGDESLLKKTETIVWWSRGGGECK